MSIQFNNLNDFLKHHKAIDKTQITHTSIGNIEQNIYPGKYCIPEEKVNQFYKLYYNHVFIQKRDAYLTEVQQKKDAGPLLVDIDFRYKTDVKDRQHCEEQIIDIIDLYLSQINEITNIQTDTHFRVYVLEKPNVNCLEDKTKDGIHLVFELKMDHSLQVLLRKKVLTKIGEILDDLPLTNEFEDVLDNGISEGFTNWQMYGSRKPNHDAYELSKFVEFEIDEDGEIHALDKDIHDVDHLHLLNRASAHYQQSVIFGKSKLGTEKLNAYLIANQRSSACNGGNCHDNTHKNDKDDKSHLVLLLKLVWFGNLLRGSARFWQADELVIDHRKNYSDEDQAQPVSHRQVQPKNCVCPHPCRLKDTYHHKTTVNDRI